MVGNAGVWCYLMHGRQQAVGKLLGFIEQYDGRVEVVVANLPRHIAVTRNDVQGGTTRNHARVDGGKRHVKQRVKRALRFKPAAHGGEFGYKLAGDFNGIDPLWRQGRMGFKAAHGRFVSVLAFVRNHHLHACGLTHNATSRLEALIEHVGDQATHADAADFFVIAQSQM